MNKKAIQRLQQMLDWSDRLGSDETSEIQDIILLLKLENSTADVIKDLKNSLKNKLVSTKQVIDLIKEEIYLEDNFEDSEEIISIKDLEFKLNKFFNK